MKPEPITRFHTCNVCGCHVPDRGYERVLQVKVQGLATALRECRQRLKAAFRG